VLIGLEWLPVVKGWALQSQKSQSLCEFQANRAFGTIYFHTSLSTAHTLTIGPWRWLAAHNSGGRRGALLRWP
jgi:hypothetical protein